MPTQPDFPKALHCVLLPGLCDRKLNGQHKQNHLKQQSYEGQITFASKYHTVLIEVNDNITMRRLSVW